MEEQNLSQKMNHLSTSNNNENVAMIKDIKVEVEKIPNYLTKQNKAFKQILHQVQLTITAAESKNNVEDLRKIAILIYKIMIIQTYQLLWTTYLKSGMGQLVMSSKTKLSYSIPSSIWPKDIKAIVLSKNVDNTNEHESCLKFVRDHLHELDQQLKNYQMEVDLKAKNLQGYTLTSQKMIEIYIEQHLRSLRIEIEHKVELVYFDYHIQALKLEYSRQNPNTFQEQLMKELCQSKYEQETTEQEVNFLKQQINYYNSSRQSFQCSPTAHDPLINSIQNLDIRQQLFQSYKQTAEQARANIFALYMKTAEEQRDEYKKKHEANLTKMWNAYHLSSDNEKISPRMLDLMHQRCMKISERIKCIYKFKTESIVSNSKP